MHYLTSKSSVLLLAVLACGVSGFADPVISEFMAANKTTLADENGDYSDWIEIHNPDAAPVNLADWSLTDNAGNKTKWRFPAVTIPAGGYLLVFASSKDRVDPAQGLHTNFSLSADGEYLGLIKPDGTTASSEYAPAYPAQSDDIAYGFAGNTNVSIGFLQTATPAAANSGLRASPIDQAVTFSTPPGLFANSLTLTLAGATGNQKIRYTLTTPSNAGAATAAPTAASPLYTGALQLTSSVIVRAAVFSADDSTQGPTMSAQYVRYATSGAQRLDTFASQLPLLVLDNHGLGLMLKQDGYQAGWLYGFAPSGSGSTSLTGASAFALPMEFGVRGNSSAGFPKQSFKLKLRDQAGKKQAITPFGLGNFEKWQLIGPWYYDRSLIRNAYIYALSNRIGLWAPRTRFVEVFVNRNDDGLDAGDYAGVYALTDKIEPGDDRVAIKSIKPADVAEPNISGGYIFKVDYVDADDYTWETGDGVTIVLDTPDAEDVVPAQGDYLKDHLARFESALHADIASAWNSRTYRNYINPETWIDFHLLNTLSKNGDAFSGSTFFTKDRNGKISAGPLWDFDRSMGSADYRNTAWDEWRSVEDGGDGWYGPWWGWLMQDPDFRQNWIDRWQNLRQAAFSDATLLGLADELAGQIGTAAADRDAALYPENASQVPGGYMGEITYLKDWLRNRAQWIDRQFTGVPTLVKNGDKLTLTPPAGTEVVYTLDGSDPRASGGGLERSAQTSTAPVELPAAANVRARARQTGTVTFPATPWSSLVAFTGTGTVPPPSLQPLENTQTAAGKTISFTAGNTPGTIRWQISTDGGVTWSNLADTDVYGGTASATLTITNPGAALDGTRYRYVSTHFGSTYSSNSATLTVLPAFFQFPVGIASDTAGNLYVSDARDDTVHLINPSRQVRTLAGEDDPGGFNRPNGLVILPDGILLVADTANAVVRRVSATGTISTFAGQPGVRGSADGAGAQATFSSPRNIARHATGALYVADAMNHTIRKISPDGTVSTFAGTAGASGTADGIGSAARFNYPMALAFDASGNLYVADTTNNTIRKITPAGAVTTLAGLPGVSGYDDGTGLTALFNRPSGLVVDPAGNIFVADTGNSTIRKVTPAGTVTTLAGTAGIAGNEDGAGGNALFNQPRNLTLDVAGNLYVTDTGNALIRKVTSAGEVSVLALSESPTTNNPGTPPPPPPPTNSGGGSGGGGGGGGGAPSVWFLLSLSVLALRRLWRQRNSTARL